MFKWYEDLPVELKLFDEAPPNPNVTPQVIVLQYVIIAHSSMKTPSTDIPASNITIFKS